MKSPKKKSSLIKVFISLVLVMVLSGTLALAFIRMAQFSQPDFVENIIDMINKKTNSSKNYHESAEEDSFNLENITINSVNSDIVINSYDGSTVRAEYDGVVDEKFSSKLINMSRQQKNLNINLNPVMHSHNFRFVWKSGQKGLMNYDSNEENNHNELKIYVPKHYSKNLEIKQLNGDISLSQLQLNNLKISTKSSDIEMSRIEGQDVNILLAEGELNIENIKTRNANIKIHSGNCRISLSPEHNYQFKLKAASGDIVNNYRGKPSKNSKTAESNFDISVNSGDIFVENFTESTIDNE